MYPSGELARLADRKALLQARIAVRRWECVAAAGALSRPLAMIDRGVEVWQRISPFVKLMGVPLGIFLARVAARKRKGKPAGKSKLGAIMTALPIILRGINMARDVRAAHAAHRARMNTKSPAPPTTMPATTVTPATAARPSGTASNRAAGTPPRNP